MSLLCNLYVDSELVDTLRPPLVLEKHSRAERQVFCLPYKCCFMRFEFVYYANIQIIYFIVLTPTTEDAPQISVDRLKFTS